MADSTNFDDALEAFLESVRENIKLLSSKDPKVRMKAAAWLGEAGEPTAITMLMRVYKDDTDPKVRAAAQHSLGMFRKLEQELKKPDQTRVQKLLEDITVHGKMGRRLPISVRSLVKFEIALLISAILVVALASILPSLFRQSVRTGTQQNDNPISTIAPTMENPTAPAVMDKDRAALLTDLHSTLTKVTNNATTLQVQYQGMLGGGALDCKQFFDTLIPVALSPNNTRDFTDLAAIATDINNLEASFRSAKATYDRVCDNGEKVDASEFGAPMGQVVALLQSMTTTQTALTTAAAKPT